LAVSPIANTECVSPSFPVDVYSTCVQSLDHDSASYLERVIDVSRWSEEAGCKGMLIYTDNSIVDPWFVAQMTLLHTKSLLPLVAVQPIYMHPYWLAKKVTSLAYLHRRQVALNMLAGGFKNDLIALNDSTPHDRRYARMVEYTHIFTRLLQGKTVSFHGEFYTVEALSLKPALPPELYPLILSSGSSDAGLAAAREIQATAVQYPAPPGEFKAPDGDGQYGLRVGIVARNDAETAWEIALARFPEDRRGALTHELAMKVSDSQWHQQLSARPKAEGRTTYWLGPFQHSKSNCPYLVGDYSQVAGELAKYMKAGFQTIILDIPPTREELEHIGGVFRLATRMAGNEAQ